MMVRRLRTMPGRASSQRIFSALTLRHELVEQLNAFQPVMLVISQRPGRSAHEQQAGRLRIHPVHISAAGETLTAAPRQLIAEAFDWRVSNYYGSSEAIALTYECRAGRLHVNSDWYIVEPVDEHAQPVRPDSCRATCSSRT